MKVIFMGTPDFAVPCLEKLIEDGHQVEAVFTREDKPVGRKKVLTAPPVQEVALKHEIKVFQPKKLRDNPEAFEIIKNINPDLIVVVAYGRILPKEILEFPKYGCVNVHGSLLPRHRGSSPIQWSIVCGDSHTGVCTMQMDAGMDTGDILLCEKTEILNDETAEEVWNKCNDKLAQDDMTVCSIIKKSNVKLIGTTDDPIDDLRWHKKILEQGKCSAKVVPSFRPDKAVNIEKAGFVEYIAKLSEAAGIEIKTAADVKKALSLRLDYFCSLGCCATDHGLDYVPYIEATDSEIEAIFAKAMNGEKVTMDEADAYKTAILIHLGREYADKGIVMQLHYGAQRNTNTNMFNKLGPDTGFDCISVKNCGEAITAFLNALAIDNKLPKTILYSLNPNDNEMLDTILGCFQGTEVAGKIQHGSAWWFSDTKSGMETQLKSLANLSLLGNFVGMLTDSRSFLSYTRHEYFRRILCNLIGQWVENGEYPDDEKTLGKMVQDICYNNAARYFNVD